MSPRRPTCSRMLVANQFTRAEDAPAAEVCAADPQTARSVPRALALRGVRQAEQHPALLHDERQASRPRAPELGFAGMTVIHDWNGEPVAVRRSRGGVLTFERC